MKRGLADIMLLETTKKYNTLSSRRSYWKRINITHLSLLRNATARAPNKFKENQLPCKVWL